jgi:hypothetical protein
MLGSTSNPALPAPLPNRPSRSKAYILLCLLLFGLGNPSPWITCRAFLLLSMAMTVFLWSSTDSLRWSIMMACKKSITTEATDKLFFERVWVHFGIPQSIISDRDNRFLSTFWSSLWSMLDTKLTKSMLSTPKLMAKQRSSTR